MKDRKDQLMTTFAKGAERTDSVLPLLDAIYAECPELAGQPCVASSVGEMGHVVLFPKVVSKAPKGSHDFAAYDLECNVMQMLSEAGIDKVPQVLHVGKKAHFFNQERKDGVMLEKDRLHLFSETDKQNLAREIAEYINDVAKAGTPEKLSAIGVPVEEQPKGEELMSAFSDNRLRKLLGSDFDFVRAGVSDYCAQLPGKMSIFMHADLNWTNILVDPATSKLKGVIDYGMCEYAPPELGLAPLYRGLDKDFVDMIAKSYAEITGQKQITQQDGCLCMLTRLVHWMSMDLDKSGEQAEKNSAYRLNQIRNLTHKLQEMGYSSTAQENTGAINPSSKKSQGPKL